MRLALVVVLSLVLSGCALWRKDRAEPVDNEPTKPKAEPVLLPSEALKPESLEIASPVTDHFYMRATYYQPTVETELRLDSTNGVRDGTLLSAEEDLGLDDVINQGRVDFDVRMGKRSHMRVDFFKLSRFREKYLPRAIDFGDFTFAEGTTFRGPGILPFFPGLFRMAEQYGIPVVPIAIEYADPSDAWVGDDPFLPHFLATFGKPRVRVRIVFGRPVHARHVEDLRAHTSSWIRARVRS